MTDEAGEWDNGMGQPDVADWSGESQPQRKANSVAGDDGTAAHVIHKKLTGGGYKHVANAMKENPDNSHTFTNWYKNGIGPMIAVAHDEADGDFTRSKNTRSWVCDGAMNGGLNLDGGDAELTGGDWHVMDGTHAYLCDGVVLAGPYENLDNEFPGESLQSYFEDEPELSLDAELTGGHWVTMDGSHVYIGGDGNIKAGPAHLKHLIGTKYEGGSSGGESKAAPAPKKWTLKHLKNRLVHRLKATKSRLADVAGRRSSTNAVVKAKASPSTNHFEDDHLPHKASQETRAAIEKKSILTPEQQHAAAAKLKDLSAKGHIFRAEPMANAKKIIESGRFKTQFETGTSSAAYNPKLRAKAEEVGLGAAQKMDPKHRPIYGYMHHEENGGAAARSYGGVKFKFKDSVRPRTTLSVGDSLGSFTEGSKIGTSVNNPTHHSLGTSGHEGLNKATHIEDVGGKDRFTETQIHGGTSLDDVDKVIIPKKMHDAEFEKLKQKHLDPRGIKVEYDG